MLHLEDALSEIISKRTVFSLISQCDLHHSTFHFNLAQWRETYERTKDVTCSLLAFFFNKYGTKPISKNNFKQDSTVCRCAVDHLKQISNVFSLLHFLGFSCHCKPRVVVLPTRIPNNNEILKMTYQGSLKIKDQKMKKALRKTKIGTLPLLSTHTHTHSIHTYTSVHTYFIKIHKWPFI